jgi:lipid II:glycine glycyltransferase (peptidoglycan interpeptide bridge formation enzyme)
MNVTLDQLKKYISETEEDGEFYMAALKYIDNMQKTFNDILIEALEKRLSLSEAPAEEQEYHRSKRINNTINKVILVLAILAAIYAFVMSLGILLIAK